MLQASPADPLAIEGLQRIARRHTVESIPSVELVEPTLSSARKAEKTRILILAGNPKGISPLRLDEEVREILEGLRRTQRREQFIIEQRWAIRPRDLQRAMLDFEPQIIHFIGSETEQGLVLEDETGELKLVSIEALATLFSLFSGQLKCVLLDGCYSEAQAQAIARHIDYVIGMKQGIGSKATIEFAVSFYDALGAGQSLDFAYEFGCNAIAMAGVQEVLSPFLLKRAQAQPKVSDKSIEILHQFLELTGANVHSSGTHTLEVLSTPNQLEAYIPLPVLLVKNKLTKQDINELIRNSAQLAGNRPSYAGILIYQQRPDPLALMWIAEARLLNNCLIVPIPSAEIEKALPDKDKCTAVLAEYVDRYIQRSDFFDDKNAISDTLSFFGRIDLLNKLEQELLRYQGVGLFGIRKSGKTSVLYQLGFLLRKHPVIHIDLQQYSSSFYGADLFNAILQQLFLLVKERLPFRASAIKIKSFTSGTPAKELTNVFVKKFCDLSESLKLTEYKLPVFCFIDEIERILPSSQDSKERVEEFNAFFGAMRVLSQQKQSLAILIADVHPDCNRINNWPQEGVATNPVFSFFKEIFLSPFSEQETVEMLTGLGNLMGLEFDRNTPIEIYKESGGHPYIARQLARFITLNLPKDSKGVLQCSLDQEFWKDLLFEHDELSNYFEKSIWEDLRKRGFESAMTMLKVIAANKTEVQDVDETSLIAKLSHCCSKYDCQMAIKWLMKVGLLDRKEKNKNRAYSIKVPHFLRWLQMNMNEEELQKWQIK